MGAMPDPKRAQELCGDLAGMAEALAQFAQREFPQAEPAQPRRDIIRASLEGRGALGAHW